MRLRNIVVGSVEASGPVAKSVAPNPSGLTVIRTDADPVLLALAVRETLTAPVRTTGETAPFVSVETTHGDIELTVADDASSGTRMMTRGRVRAIPEVVEVHTHDSEALVDGALDMMFQYVAEAAGVDRIEALAPALAHVGEPVADELSEAARRFLEASGRARVLGDAVRSVDDEMTASVVPDWLWIATGLGGVGVLCTVVALLYPELRMTLVVALGVLSVVGFSLYGWRAFLEMKTRGRLQEERVGLRTRREAAREEAKHLGEALAQSGEDPNALLVAHADRPPPPSAPAVLGMPHLDRATADALSASGRQIIVFAGTTDVPSTTLSTPDP